MEVELPITQQFKAIDWLVGLGLGLAALALYTATLAPTVLEADAGEFQFVPWLPGVAHPTGYPLYVMLGWLWTHLLPLGDVAWRMNLLSAVLAASGVGMIYAVARQLLDATAPQTPPAARLITAAITAATFAVTPTFWSQAIIAEVYALHTLVAALILWLALGLRGSDVFLPNNHRSKLLAFLFGLGLTHHVTTGLLLPALLLFLWLTHSPGNTSRSTGVGLKILAGHALIAAAPLLLYLYLPLAAPSTPYATLTLSPEQPPLVLYDNSVSGFVQHITGTVFAGALQPAAVGLERFTLTWNLLHQQVGWTGIALAGLGLVALWQQRLYDLLALTGLSFVAVVLFNLIYFIGDVFVLFIPAWLVVCLWLGLGTLSLTHWLVRRFVQQKTGSKDNVTLGQMKARLEQNIYRMLMIGLPFFFFALPASLLLTYLPAIDQSDNTAAARRWQAILAEPIPASAILLSNDRNEIMPMWYYQYVNNQRPDLVGLFPLITPDPLLATVGGVLDQALASNRAVYLIKPMDGLRLKANLAPVGSLYRATPYNSPPATALQISLPAVSLPPEDGESRTESIKLAGYDLDPTPTRPGSSLAIDLHWQVTQPLSINYTSYVHLIDPNGQRLAQSDQRPGGVIYPSSQWQVGEMLRDQHTLQLPESAAPGLYRLRAGMYYQPQPGLIAGMGNGVEIGVVTVD